MYGNVPDGSPAMGAMTVLSVLGDAVAELMTDSICADDGTSADAYCRVLSLIGEQMKLL